MLLFLIKRRVWIVTDNPVRFKYACAKALLACPTKKGGVSAAKYKNP